MEFGIFRALGLSISAGFRNIVPFSMVAAVVYAPVFIYVALFDFNGQPNPDTLFKWGFMAPFVATLGLSALLSPLLTYCVIQQLNGNRVPMMTSVKFGMRGIVPAVVLAVVTSLVQLLPAGGIISMIITCIWFVAAPAAVAERLGPWSAFVRSTELTRGRRWGIFGINFLIGLAVGIPLIAWIAPAVERGDLGSMRTWVLLFVVGIAVFEAFLGIVQAVSYALLRRDKDGVSAEELARVFE